MDDQIRVIIRIKYLLTNPRTTVTKHFIFSKIINYLRLITRLLFFLINIHMLTKEVSLRI